MGTDTSPATVTVYMVLLGVGIGFTMQTLVLATQNAVPAADLGAATSSVSFFRSMGGSIGVALFGALFNAALTTRLGGIAISAREASSFTPERLAQLPAGVAQDVANAFAGALTTVFLYSVPVIVVAVGLSLLLRELPLRSTTHAVDYGRELAAGSAPGTAEPEVAGIID
jgi:hypothetical protein